MAISVFLNFAGFTLIIPVLPFSVARYVTPTDVAWWVSLILALYSLCAFLAAPVLGAMSDRFGRRPVILLSLGGAALGFGLFGVGGSIAVLVVGRVIEGLTAGSISALYAYVADTHAPTERGRVFGTLGAAGGLGFMAGPVVGGALGQVSLSAPLFGAAGLALANCGLVWFLLPESRPRSKGAPWRLHHFNAIAQLLHVLRERRIRPLFAAVFCFAFAGAAMQANLTVILRDLFAFGPAGIGFILACVGVMDVVSQGIAAPRLQRRFGEQPVATAGLVINGLGLALIALLPLHAAVPVLVAGIAIVTFGDGLFQPSVSALIANAAPVERQGEVQGANQAQQAIARTTGPLLAAWLYGLSASAPYAVGAGVVVLAATWRVRKLR
ncbi:MFS transporter [Massilia arenosa]|uniref:MFS transporter n=1 Tax=Zemynaea arenosa TaxID=2561931 RepID=A0A4Y9SC25_9BURK|nr:MFS transporter [Massilia arenosa]